MALLYNLICQEKGVYQLMPTNAEDMYDTLANACDESSSQLEHSFHSLSWKTWLLQLGDGVQPITAFTHPMWLLFWDCETI